MKDFGFSRRLLLKLPIGLGLTRAAVAQSPELQLPNGKDSFHFAVIGDTGTGGQAQYEVASQLAKSHEAFSFNIVTMMGDNMYGGESAKDFQRKFEQPYKPLLDAGVKFYASLGNHDNPSQANYEKFNMNGERYYSFKPRDGIRFFAIDSNYMDRKQLEWIDKSLNDSKEDWKIAFFHHPPYSSGETHGSSVQIRTVLEPMFLQHGVSLVLSGHEHFYERIKPQKGIPYFIVGSSAKLRRGNIEKTDLTAKGFDIDYAYMLCEIDKDKLHFQTISRAGKTIDNGMLDRPNTKSPAGPAK